MKIFFLFRGRVTRRDRGKLVKLGLTIDEIESPYYKIVTDDFPFSKNKSSDMLVWQMNVNVGHKDLNFKMRMIKIEPYEKIWLSAEHRESEIDENPYICFDRQFDGRGRAGELVILMKSWCDNAEKIRTALTFYDLGFKVIINNELKYLYVCYNTYCLEL